MPWRTPWWISVLPSVMALIGWLIAGISYFLLIRYSSFSQIQYWCFPSTLTLLFQTWRMPDLVAWWDCTARKNCNLSFSNGLFEVNSCWLLEMYVVNRHFDGVLILCSTRWMPMCKHGVLELWYVSLECIFIGVFAVVLTVYTTTAVGSSSALLIHLLFVAHGYVTVLNKFLW